jgi:hypothetical protein
MEKNTPRLFERENLIWMGVGALLILAGILLMSGGKSADPNVFNDGEVYGFRRITVAPVLIILGLATEVYAIMKRGKSE